MAPVLMACWGMGRLLGPQLMVAGGGHPTNQWFGMYYAGQQGRRLPVPIFQAMEDFAIFGILLLVERWLRSSAPVPAPTEDGTEPAPVLLPPAGIVIGVGMVLWGLERFLDEHLWLGEDGHLGSLLVQGAGIALAVVGAVLLLTRLGPLQRWRRGEGGDPVPVPPGASGADEVADGEHPGIDPDGTADAEGDGDDSSVPSGGPVTGDGSAGPNPKGPIPAVVPSVPAVGPTGSPDLPDPGDRD